MDRIGKYEIQGQIGSGGFATVFKGYDPFIKREVAIKICYANDAESRQRFFREAEIAGRLKHENITTVYDFGVHAEDPYLVEEYLDGEDLTQRLRRREPADLATKIDVLVQIARGLEYAHREGVIHRDIKPGNVRVLDDGTIKIMDFGTAKLAGVESHLTQKGMTLGTVAYLSPERLLGRDTGTNSDIFSYGVLAYELLSFRRPFSGRNIPHLIDQVINAAPIPLADSWPDCPPKLSAIVDRCLLKDPQERYATCGDILGDLETVALESLGRLTASFRDETTGVPTAAGASADVQVAGFFERARKLHADGKHERALMVLEEVLEMAPGHADARSLLDAVRAALHDDAATPSTETGLIAIE
ncbi:MAG: serine/threonine-protein kinase, partial [Acidobacteriota bacterium]